MAEGDWQTARLIPTSGISGPEEQERRASSALLAVVAAVKEFGRALLGPLGAPAGSLQTYIEVPFDLDGRRVIPDGLIRATRGQRSWTVLVEVKTGANCLQASQLEDYLDVARENGFDGVLTVSNEIPSIPGMHPTAVDKRKLRKAALHHLSWTQVLTDAVVQQVHRGVSDPDQSWILSELIRYLEHPKSGAMEFEDMGASWVAVRNGVRSGTLKASDRAIAEVVGRWDQLIRYSCLRLGRELGTAVQTVLTRKEMADPAGRTQALVAALLGSGAMSSQMRIPNTVGPIEVRTDLRAGQVCCSIEIEAPGQGRTTTRVNWLVRQLREAPEDLRVEASYLRGRAGVAELLKVVRERPEALVEDSKKELTRFRLTLTVPMGTKRGQGRGSFVHSVLSGLDVFYRTVVQHLKPWTPPPPKLREQESLETTTETEAGIGASGRDSTDIQAQLIPQQD